MEDGPGIRTAALRIAYEGPSFPGYPLDGDKPHVEAHVIKALRSTGYVEGSLKSGSRTDRGVGALENVLRVRLDRPHLHGLLPAVQAKLPQGIYITGAAWVDADWNPRRASSRTYQYKIASKGENLAAMEEACRGFLGAHDLRGFARMEPHRDPHRVIMAFHVEPEGKFWTFTVESPGFLWNQVRRMVGAVLQVGIGKLTLEDLEETRKTGIPHAKMTVSPPEGLLLHRVQYDPPIAWDPVAGTIPDNPVTRRQLELEGMRAVLTRVQEEL